ncbi:hypothetical protein DPMN_137445 [Dreissena polymorpha]|uniref:Uncharacterized protein n=1 Tax=Dreissena polymorpha TaxID=45954 RepID=A0A9D4G2S3_DREPO|nr:hypothetical protein DPMN_137445 [Dreissena polymorpha]
MVEEGIAALKGYTKGIKRTVKMLSNWYHMYNCLAVVVESHVAVLVVVVESPVEVLVVVVISHVEVLVVLVVSHWYHMYGITCMVSHEEHQSSRQHQNLDYEELPNQYRLNVTVTKLETKLSSTAQVGTHHL